MNELRSSIEFINHASVLVSFDDVSILSDPWYSGDAFHKGWNLLHETSDEQVIDLLGRTTHIWISHEHPDHFSVKFFKTHHETIKLHDIEILFQETRDQRVVKFLKAQGFKVTELPFDVERKISGSTSVLCLKDGFYDSGLLIKNGDEKILNLNDCEVTSSKRANEVKKVVGEVDVLLTQFSFAAWKGGVDNKAWRNEAATEKLATMKLQVDTFKPKFVIPFASFIYFSNKLNFYLNDAVNRLSDIERSFNNPNFKLALMQPGDILGGEEEKLDNEAAKEFWDARFNGISENDLNSFQSKSVEEISIAFQSYCDRIISKNSKSTMRAIRRLSPIKAFYPVEIYLVDRKLSVRFDYLDRNILFGEKLNPMLEMHSESLHFLFQNGFGFDTLTVNGCFEEHPGGFVRATKSLAVENLNNLGIYVTPKTLFNVSIIKLFLVRLYRVAKKLE